MNVDGAANPITDVYDQSLAEVFLAQVRRHADRPAIDGAIAGPEWNAGEVLNARMRW